MADERDLPEGRLSRFTRLAALGMRTGAGLLTGDAEIPARRAAEVLGTLRGLAAKLGQMASYVDGVVPEQHRETWEAALRGLRAQAPRSSASEIRRVVEEELGAPIDRLFAAWDDAPLASASIGQVHRAVLENGREVAVKVQHPGIARAVESDLANAGFIEAFVGMGVRRFDTRSMLQVIRQRFREELDYRLEAGNLAYFAAIHAHDPGIRIPALVAERTAARVLTTELVRGATFEEACAAGERERLGWADTLWRFVFRGNMVGGRFNADPHPGNYVFQEEGRIAFLDFGCVQGIGERKLEIARRMHLAALDHDEPTFTRSAAEIVDSRPGPLQDMAVDYMRVAFAPLLHSPYRITRPYAASLVDGMKEMALAARRVEEDQFFTMSPDNLFMNRLQFGFYSVLARLDVDADYRASERSFWHEVPEGGRPAPFIAERLAGAPRLRAG